MQIRKVKKISVDLSIDLCFYTSYGFISNGRIIVYYSIGITELAFEFGGKLAKVGLGFSNYAQNFNAGFVKPTLYNILSFIFNKVFN